MHHALPRLALLVCCAVRLAAADWHVDPGGSDTTGSGSQVFPWRTIAHALAHSAASDRILLARGGTWRETFTLGGNRQLLAYGSGADPVVTASSVAAFTGTAGSARTVAIAGQVRAVWIDGAFCRLARFPNKGASPEWLRIEAGTTNTSIVDSGLPARAAGRHTGAQVRWRRWSWWYETRQITADGGGTTLTLANDMPSGTTGTYDSLGNSPDGQGSCYYIDNDLDLLDAPGEWFWSGGTLRVILPAGSTASTVEYVTGTTGITINGGTVRDIAFRRFGGTALSIGNPSTLEDCTIEEVEDTGISLSWNAAPSTIRRCVLRDVRNTGIYANENPAGSGGTLIERNLLQRIGVEPGYGGSGTWRQAGVILGNAKSDIVRLNRVVDVGYAGVIAGSPGQTIDRNIFVRCMQTLNDGAAIYTNCSNTTITANLVLDTIGDLSSSHPWWPLGHGIWPEFLKDFHDQVIEDNTVFGSNGNGIVLNNEYTCSVRRNVLVDNRSHALALDVTTNTDAADINDYGVAENADDDLRAQNHVISDNLLAAAATSRRLVRPENLNQWYLPPYTAPLPALISSYGTVDYGAMTGSTFVAPASGTGLFRATTPDRSWTTMSTWAAGNASWAVNALRQAAGQVHLLINDTETAAAIAVPAGSWTLPDGTVVGASVTVAAFRSVALVTGGSLPAAPYTVASGVDWRASTPTVVVLGDTEIPVGGGSGGSGGAAGGGGGGCGAGGLGAGLILACALVGLSPARRRRADRRHRPGAAGH